MGYTTDFSGYLSLSRELTDVEKNYINKLHETRRMKRNVKKLMEMFNGEHGHPTPKSDKPEDIYGVDGEYFVGGGGFAGQDRDDSIIDYNTPPGQISSNSDVNRYDDDRYEKNYKRIINGECQPSLWLQWEITNENTLEWDGGEKFYSYVEWLEYLIKHFFEPWGVKLNGEIEWCGEDVSDKGLIKVNDNIVKIGKPTYTFDEE